jgi:hypothetical protein
VGAERPVAGGLGLHSSGWAACGGERLGLQAGGLVRLSSRQSAGRGGGGGHSPFSGAVMKASLILRPDGTLRIEQTTAPARDMRAGGLRHLSRSVAAEGCASTMTLTVVPVSLAALTDSSAPLRSTATGRRLLSPRRER